MTLPKQTNPTQEDRRAKAPYNFVPLPEEVVLAKEPPDMDRYHPGLYSGWLECELTNNSPLYIRAGLTEEEAKDGKEAKDQADFFFLDPQTREPVIPGSSLRGMFRTLIEIITYSKVQPVTNDPLFYRAVGDTSSLGKLYRGYFLQSTDRHRYKTKVKAGYMHKSGKGWMIIPASPLAGEPFARIERRQIPHKLPQWTHCPNAQTIYVQVDKPQYHPHNHNRIELWYAKVKSVSAKPRIGYKRAVLVKTGHAPRKHMDFVFGVPNKSLKPIPIPETLEKAYMEQLTQQQIALLGKQGVFREQQPVFYLLDDHGQLHFFGHTMMFRLPYEGSPLDFVPTKPHTLAENDIAEALFGYVEQVKTGKRRVALAGRLSFSDARCAKPCEPMQTLVPHILGTPKPTTFQHYLVQDAKRGHNPNVRKELAHYGTPTPDETVIRGHKLYWHKGKIEIEAIKEDERKVGPQAELMEKVKSGADTQHTIIRPLEPGACFRFRIDFENLQAEELGALLWLLEIAADDRYRLKLGMGKPLGMGAVKIISTLHLIDREARYRRLFEGNTWATGEIKDSIKVEEEWARSVRAFEQMVLQEVNSNNASRLKDVDRIQELLALLAWPGPNRELTRYLEIEHPVNGNEYKERPVLPKPTDVQQESAPQAQPSSHQPGPTTSPHPTDDPSETTKTPKQNPPPPPPAPCTAETLKHPRSADEIKRGDCLEGELIGLNDKQAIIELKVSQGNTKVQGTVQAEEIANAFASHNDEELQEMTWEEIMDVHQSIEHAHHRLIVRVQGRKKGKKIKSPWKLQFVRWLDSESQEGG